MDELTLQDYQDLLTIINNTTFQGKDLEYILLLKSKIQLKIKENPKE